MNLWKRGELDILWIWGTLLLVTYAWDVFQ